MEESKVLHKKTMLAPKLRFKEYKDSWNKSKLNQLAQINPNSKFLPEKFIYIDLESVVKGRLLKEDEIEKNSAPSRAQRYLKENDILFQMVRPYQMNNLFFDKTGEYVASTGYAQLRTKEHPKFLYQYLHLKSFVGRVIEKCTGTSYPSINSSDLGNIQINIPSLPEQQKIAAFLGAVDEKIQLLNRKKELLEHYKKGVMQQLFSGKLRFKSENGKDYPKWEEKKLGDQLEMNATYGIVTAGEFQNTGVKMIRGGDIKNGRINPELPLVSQNKSKEYKRTELKENDIVIALVGYPGEAAKIPNELIGHNISRAVGLLRFNSNIYHDYAVQFLNSPEGRKRVLKPSAGSAQQVVNLKALNSLEVPFPTYLEQKKIADYLSALDKKLEQLNQQITQTQNFKKGLLQQMFV